MKVKDLFWIVVFGAAGIYAYEKIKSTPALPLEPAAIVKPIATEPEVEDRSGIKQRETQPAALASNSSSKCDGRISCPQMRSCAEATFFIQNCPHTAMDGDRDGIPCEDQWCR